jgi:hypothetical protein
VKQQVTSLVHLKSKKKNNYQGNVYVDIHLTLLNFKNYIMYFFYNLK